jgi:hypothetical protein
MEHYFSAAFRGSHQRKKSTRSESSYFPSHAGEGARVTVCASLARENFVKQSYGNDGAMDSQHEAFHISLGISQKTRDSHIPTAPATGCFTGVKKDSKRKNRRPVTQKS